jgi:hypothetical protein
MKIVGGKFENVHDWSPRETIIGDDSDFPLIIIRESKLDVNDDSSSGQVNTLTVNIDVFGNASLGGIKYIRNVARDVIDEIIDNGRSLEVQHIRFVGLEMGSEGEGREVFGCQLNFEFDYITTKYRI